ncbi:MAG: hypothetical protein QGG90_14200, partial [Nitrospinota bacterium]|nr:hypothetical protein [Nitrospinota bacterium]
RWEGGRVHESVQVTGSTGQFKGEIYHHTYASLSEYLEQLERFSSLAALGADAVFILPITGDSHEYLKTFAEKVLPHVKR